jgi:hypothetical protein
VNEWVLGEENSPSVDELAGPAEGCVNRRAILEPYPVDRGRPTASGLDDSVRSFVQALRFLLDLISSRYVQAGGLSYRARIASRRMLLLAT